MLNISLASGAGRILTGTTLALLLAFTTGIVRAETPAVGSESSFLSNADLALPSAPMAQEKSSAKDASDAAPIGRLQKHLALEAGGGMNFPMSAISGYNRTGYNATIGAGWMFTRQFGTMLEYQFIDDALTSYARRVLSAGNCSPLGGLCASGTAYTNAFTVAPILYFVDESKYNAYITLGVGVARKTTTTSVTYYGANSIVGNAGVFPGATTHASYSDVRLAYDYGIGMTRQAEWNHHVKYFAEVRYLRVDTTKPFGLNPNAVGRTVLAPLTIGLRY